jgi:hypothetical protein
MKSPPWVARLVVGGGRPVVLVVANFGGSEQSTLPLVTVPSNAGWSRGLPVVKTTLLRGSLCIVRLWCNSAWSCRLITCEAVDFSAKSAGARGLPAWAACGADRRCTAAPRWASGPACSCVAASRVGRSELLDRSVAASPFSLLRYFLI